MRKLNPITALYLKVLEFMSILLINVGGKIDDFVDTKNATPEQIKRCNKSSCWYGAPTAFETDKACLPTSN